MGDASERTAPTFRFNYNWCLSPYTGDKIAQLQINRLFTLNCGETTVNMCNRCNAERILGKLHAVLQRLSFHFNA